MRIPLVLFLLAFVPRETMAGDITDQERAKLASYLPSGESRALGDWRQVSKPALYVEDNLYEYIDGAAEEYIAYGFRLVATAMYKPDDERPGLITVDIYDMGSDINAFGIYAFGRVRDVELLRIGTQSYLMDGYLFCWKGRYFVKVTPAKASPEIRPAVLAFARATAGAIPAAKGSPELLKLLPKKGLIPLTEGYTRINVLGQEYLRNGVSGRYKAKGGELELLIADFEGVPAAADALAKFKEYQSTPPRTAQAMTGFGDEGFEGEDPYYKQILACRYGCYIVAVLRVQDRAEGEDLLRQALNRVRRGEP